MDCAAAIFYAVAMMVHDDMYQVVLLCLHDLCYCLFRTALAAANLFYHIAFADVASAAVMIRIYLLLHINEYNSDIF